MVQRESVSIIISFVMLSGFS